MGFNIFYIVETLLDVIMMLMLLLYTSLLCSVTATHSIGSAFSTPTAKRNRSTDGITPASATSTTNTTAGEVGDQNKVFIHISAINIGFFMRI